MAYRDLRKIFHSDHDHYDEVYTMRFNSDHAYKVGMNVAGNPAFFVMSPQIYEAEIAAAKLDKEIYRLTLSLPGKAIQHYMESNLIDEIVITNEIEGVNSTRREIGDALDRLEANDKRGRFHGLVQKYVMLGQNQHIPISTCNDIRRVYDDLVLQEVEEDNPQHVPDGEIFRKGPVSVCDATGIPIHKGIEPESNIIDSLEKALGFLNDPSIGPLARVSLFHFLFGYIHPFYDGNGRTNRFISSYVLSKEYEPLIGFRLSYAVKEDIKKYYKGFSICEYPLNRGDLTPFVIAFSEIAVSAMRSMRDSLKELKQALDEYEAIAKSLFGSIRELCDICCVLIAAALFAANGITMAELCQSFDTTRQTMYKKLAPLKEQSLVVTNKIGRKTYYRMDLDALRARAIEQAF